MSELVQDMQTTSTVMDIFKMFLESAEALGKTLSILASRGGEAWQKLEKDMDTQTKVMKDFINHMEKGGEIKTVEVLDYDQAVLMTQLLKSDNVPFVANRTESGMLFMYKDVDSTKFTNVAKEAEHYIQNRGHEMTHPEFMEKVGEQADYAKVDGLTLEEVAVFRREADKQDQAFIFAVKEDGKGTYEILADKKDALENVVNDTLFVMGTPQGQKYAKELVPFDKSRDEFIEKANKASQAVSPAYIIDAKNPTHIIELHDGRYKIHGVGVDKDGQMVDTVSRFSKPISHDIYNDLKSWGQPVVLSSAEATFIKGQTRGGELEFTPKYSGSPEKFLGLSQVLEENFVGKNIEPPLKEPELEVVSLAQDFREKARDMTVYQNIPLATMIQIEKANLDGVYIYNKGNTREIACTPEAEESLRTLLKENLAKDKGEFDTWLTMEKYKGHGEAPGDKSETFYVVDAAMPDSFLEISPQDVTYQNTEVIRKIEAPAGVSRDQAILAQIHDMSAPIILNKDDFRALQMEGSEMSTRIIDSYYMNPAATNVIKAEQERLNSERDKLDQIIYSPNNEKLLSKNMTPAQQYVLRQIEKRALRAKVQEKVHVKEFEINKDKSTVKEKNAEFER